METKKRWIGSSEMLKLTEMFKVMRHPTRAAIINLLFSEKGQRMTVQRFYKELKKHQPVISRHLGILKNAGLLTRIVESSKTDNELRANNKIVFEIMKRVFNN